MMKRKYILYVVLHVFIASFLLVFILGSLYPLLINLLSPLLFIRSRGELK